MGGADSSFSRDCSFQQLSFVGEIPAQIDSEGDFEQSKAKCFLFLVVVQAVDAFIRSKREGHIPLKVFYRPLPSPVALFLLVKCEEKGTVEVGEDVGGNFAFETV